MLAVIVGLSNLSSCKSNNKTTETESASVPKADLKLPEGFSATIIADSLGHLRHMAINKNGDIYVTLSSLKDGNGIYFLSDTDHNGSIDKKQALPITRALVSLSKTVISILLLILPCTGIN